jgi:hypothetical protein
VEDAQMVHLAAFDDLELTLFSQPRPQYSRIQRRSTLQTIKDETLPSAADYPPICTIFLEGFSNPGSPM